MRISLPRSVVVLGLVSFFNDTASEMIAPLLPLFLVSTLGAGPAVVGLVEGVAEATASILKLVSGRLADRGWNHKALVLGGYGVSNTARPLIGFALGWGWVLWLRFADRLGKGLRTSPRDALIAAAAGASLRGRAFGFQRALDNGGAMLGPLVAFGLIRAGLPLQQVFLASVVPGVLVILLLIKGLQNDPPPRAAAPAVRLRWRGLDARLRGLIVAAGGIAIASVPEAFLVLWASARGLNFAGVTLIWAAANGVKALVSAPAGTASDRFGRRAVLATGWIARFGILSAMPLCRDETVAIVAFFLAYSASIAATEGAERALIADAASSGHRATAYGLYHMVVGLAALPGAVLFGALWQRWGEGIAFLSAAGIGLLSTLLLLRLTRKTAAVERG